MDRQTSWSDDVILTFTFQSNHGEFTQRETTSFTGEAAFKKILPRRR